MHWDQPPTCTALSAPVRGERTQLCPAWSLLWVGASPASPLRVSSLSERHEHDARDQHPICTDEGEPAVLDSEGLPVQRCVPGCPLSPTTSPSLASRGLLTCGNRPPPPFSKSGLRQVQGHALGAGGTQGSEGHQPLLAADADRGRRRQPL